MRPHRFSALAPVREPLDEVIHPSKQEPVGVTEVKMRDWGKVKDHREHVDGLRLTCQRD